MRCKSCGSERIRYQRDALLVSEVRWVRDKTLVLDRAPAPHGLDEVQLYCADCGQEQDGVDWDDARPQHLPFGAVQLNADEALDLIVGFINEPGEVQGADFLEFTSKTVVRTGREIVDDDA